jgi:hypothetical protein
MKLLHKVAVNETSRLKPKARDTPKEKEKERFPLNWTKSRVNPRLFQPARTAPCPMACNNVLKPSIDPSLEQWKRTQTFKGDGTWRRGFSFTSLCPEDI